MADSEDDSAADARLSPFRVFRGHLVDADYSCPGARGPADRNMAGHGASTAFPYGHSCDGGGDPRRAHFLLRIASLHIEQVSEGTEAFGISELFMEEKSMTGELLCLSCDSEMKEEHDGIWVCPNCSLRQSLFCPGAGAEIQGVEITRRKNFRRILTWLSQRDSSGKKILDVGCSDGLFLHMAGECGMFPIGVEPDAEKANRAIRLGHKVIAGYFGREKFKEIEEKTFDVVIFNDSFEHIPDPPLVVDSALHFLKDDGLLVLNIPSSDGVFFKIGSLLARCGNGSLLNRLWQKDYASPHLYYFNRCNIISLFSKKNLILKGDIALSSFEIGGLWRRLRCKHGFLTTVSGFIILFILWPFLKNSGDIICLVFGKNSK